MRIVTMKSIIIILLSLVSITCFAQTIMDNDTKLVMDKSYYKNGRNNIKAYSNISAEDANTIALYACSCAYKEAQKNSLPIAATDYKTASDCIYYAVLRNILNYSIDFTSEDNTDNNAVKNRCYSSFPHDLADDSKNVDLTNFCMCAATPTEKIYNEMNSVKLNEDQIYKKLMTLLKGCRFSN